MGDVTPGGARYWLTIIDDYSRYVWTYTMRTKSETVDIITSWITLAERSTGKKVKRFRTDNGGEYMKLDALLAESGIVRETTVAGTPQQNGRAERMNRTLGEKISCMLIDSGLQPHFWGEALAAATYVINRQPCRPIKMQTPHEKLYGKGTDMDRLRVFGSPCEVLILPRVKKLAPKTKSCIFLGYAELKKAYRTWDPARKEIIFSRDVTFLEGEDKQADLRMTTPPSPSETSCSSATEDDSSSSDDDERSELTLSDDSQPGAENDGADEQEEDAPEGAQNDRAEAERRYPVRERNRPGEWWKATASVLEVTDEDH